MKKERKYMNEWEEEKMSKSEKSKAEEKNELENGSI